MNAAIVEMCKQSIQTSSIRHIIKTFNSLKYILQQFCGGHKNIKLISN